MFFMQVFSGTCKRTGVSMLVLTVYICLHRAARLKEILERLVKHLESRIFTDLLPDVLDYGLHHLLPPIRLHRVNVLHNF